MSIHFVIFLYLIAVHTLPLLFGLAPRSLTGTYIAAEKSVLKAFINRDFKIGKCGQRTTRKDERDLGRGALRMRITIRGFVVCCVVVHYDGFCWVFCSVKNVSNFLSFVRK